MLCIFRNGVFLEWCLFEFRGWHVLWVGDALLAFEEVARAARVTCAGSVLTRQVLT